jgi:outer membrane protein assembly factor BamB
MASTRTPSCRQRSNFVLFRALTIILIGATGLGIGNHASAAGQNDQNWPQWRGPLQSGVAPHADPPIEWNESKNVKWRVEIAGEGDSTPIIWENKVFISTAIGAGNITHHAATSPDQQFSIPEKTQWVVLCLDRSTGEVLWRRTAREDSPRDFANEGQHNTVACYSPVTDGQQLYVSFGSAGVYCYDLEGNFQWKHDLEESGSKRHGGESGSPTLHEGKLLLIWDHEGNDFITALDTKTGQELWKTSRTERNSWFTPLVVAHDGTAQIIATGHDRIRSYDVTTGHEIWKIEGLKGYSIPSPVAGHGLVFAMTGFAGTNKLVAIQLGRTGDLSETDAIAWRHDKHTSYIPSPLLYDDMLYFVAGNTNILSALDAVTGRTLIDAERVLGLDEIYASPVGAAGRVYLLGRDGSAVVIKQGAPIQVLATNKLNDTFDASPAVVGKEIFLRGHKYLYCIKEEESHSDR